MSNVIKQKSAIGCIFTIIIVLIIYIIEPNIQLVELENIDSYFDIESGFLYFGRPSCNLCQQFEKDLISIPMKKTDIIYFNTDNWRNEERFNEILTKYNINNVPLLLKIDNSQEQSINKYTIYDNDSKLELAKFLKDD